MTLLLGLSLFIANIVITFNPSGLHRYPPTVSWIGHMLFHTSLMTFLALIPWRAWDNFYTPVYTSIVTLIILIICAVFVILAMFGFYLQSDGFTGSMVLLSLLNIIGLIVKRHFKKKYVEQKNKDSEISKKETLVTDNDKSEGYNVNLNNRETF